MIAHFHQQKTRKLPSVKPLKSFGADGGSRTRKVSRLILSQMRLPFRHIGLFFLKVADILADKEIFCLPEIREKRLDY